MRDQGYTLSSATAGAWLPLNSKQTPFGVSVAVILNSAASGITYTVQHTFSPLSARLKATISRSTTTVTVTTKENHGLITNDSVIIQNADTLADIYNLVTNPNGGGLNGTFTVTVSSATVFTYTSGTSHTFSNYPTFDIEITPLNVHSHADLVSKTVTADGNYAFPCRAVRLNTVAGWSAGDAVFRVIQGHS